MSQSTEYALLSSAFYRQVDGVRRRFRRGDTITGLSADDVERLTKAGAIAPAGKAKAQPAEAAERPKQVASKSEWVDYAVEQGYDRDEVEEMTKADIQALDFG